MDSSDDEEAKTNNSRGKVIPANKSGAGKRKFSVKQPQAKRQKKSSKVSFVVSEEDKQSAEQRRNYVVEW